MGVNLLTSNSDSMHARSPCFELNIACMQFSDAVIIIHMHEYVTPAMQLKKCMFHYSIGKKSRFLHVRK